MALIAALLIAAVGALAVVGEGHALLIAAVGEPAQPGALDRGVVPARLSGSYILLPLPARDFRSEVLLPRP